MAVPQLVVRLTEPTSIGISETNHHLFQRWYYVAFCGVRNGRLMRKIGCAGVHSRNHRAAFFRWFADVGGCQSQTVSMDALARR
jgi:hypothetical protein